MNHDCITAQGGTRLVFDQKYPGQTAVTENKGPGLLFFPWPLLVPASLWPAVSPESCWVSCSHSNSLTHLRQRHVDQLKLVLGTKGKHIHLISRLGKLGFKKWAAPRTSNFSPIPFCRIHTTPFFFFFFLVHQSWCFLLYKYYWAYIKKKIRVGSRKQGPPTQPVHVKMVQLVRLGHAQLTAPAPRPPNKAKNCPAGHGQPRGSTCRGTDGGYFSLSWQIFLKLTREFSHKLLH